MALTVSLLDTDSSLATGGCVLDASTAASGDLLIVQIAHDSTVPSTPSGWTLRNTEVGSFSLNISTYTKPASASETSYTFTHGGSDNSGGVLVAVHGSAGTPTYDVLSSGDSAGNAQTSFDAPGVTMSAAGVIVTTFVQTDTGSTITKPASMTSLQAGDLYLSQATAYESVSSGATGTRTATATGNATWMAATVGIIEVTNDQTITMTGATVTVTPGTLSVTMSIAMATAVVTVTPGTLQVNQELLFAPAVITITPGTLTVSPDQTITMAPATITVTPGTLIISEAGAEQTITMAPATVTVIPGTLSVSVQVILAYEYLPPWDERHHPAYVMDQELSRFTTYRQGTSIIKRNGVWVETEGDIIDIDDGVEGEDYFIGGHIYTLTPALAAEIEATGFGTLTPIFEEE